LYGALSRLKFAPNLLTILRLLLTPVVIAEIIRERHLAAGLIFGLAAFTDTVDGALARRLGASSKTGQYLDPLADKILLTGVYLALAWQGSVPWWLVALILGRDLLIVVASAIAMQFTSYREYRPSIWGKLSTFLQIMTAVAAMAANVFAGPGWRALAHAMVWPTAAITVGSAIHYAWRGISYFVDRSATRAR
jgi:cardiolipin synthase